MPALNSALDALKALNKNDIVEIKSFPKPPPLVQMTMEAVCILKQEKPDWDTVSLSLFALFRHEEKGNLDTQWSFQIIQVEDQDTHFCVAILLTVPHV